MPSQLRGSFETSDASDPMMEKKLVQEPGAVPSAIHAAADAYHHHHGNHRGKSAGCGHVCLDWLING